MVEALLASDGTPRALVLTGGPGVGKTSLWEAGVEAATGRGLRVLRASGSGAETQLSFAALIDLLDGIDLDSIDGLPTPQRQALDVALYRAEAASPPDPSALALGLLSTLRSLSAVQPVLVAVDDLQWLDETSAEALAFAGRRLDTEPIAFLLARRPGPPPRSSARSARDCRAPRWGRSRSAQCAGCCLSGSVSRCRATCCAASTRRRSATRSSRSRSGGRSRAVVRRRSPRTCRCPGRRGLARDAGGAARRPRTQANARTRARSRPASVAAGPDRRRERARGRAGRGCGRT